LSSATIGLFTLCLPRGGVFLSARGISAFSEIWALCVDSTACSFCLREDEEEIDITNDDVEDSEDEDETEADEFLKPDEEETEDDEEVAKKATPNKRIGSKADQLDAVINDMKKLAADYKKAKTDGDKDKEKEIADKLKEKTKLKKELEKDINISLGDEDEDEL